MAKKRKKSSTLGLALSAGSVIFAIVALCMLFVNAVELVSGDNVLVQYKGTQVAFGYSETYPIIGEVKFLNFSFMNLLPYLLVLGGGVVAVLAALGKKSFLLNVIATACFVAEGSGSLSSAIKSIVDALKDGENLKIAIGSILGGVFSIIAAACSALKIIVK